MPLRVYLQLLRVVAEKLEAPPVSEDLLREAGSMWRIVRRKSLLAAFFCFVIIMGYEVL